MISKKFSVIEVKCNEEDLNKKGVIYCLTFENGKTYVGQTVNELHIRISNHCGKNSGCRKLKNAIQKYKSFIVSILSSNLDINQLNLFEKMFIKLLNSNGIDGYNLDSGGMNKKVSDETRLKLSESHKGYKHTHEQKNKISASLKGNKHSDETKRKISESQKGKTLSDEHKSKLMKKVKSIPDGIIFESAIECAKYYNISIKHLSRYYNSKIHRRSGQTFVLL